VPSAKSTSAIVRPYLSLPFVFRVISFPKINADVACLARMPYACPFSGQSMPLSLIRSGRWLWRTSMVSPSKTLMTTSPEAMGEFNAKMHVKSRRELPHFMTAISHAETGLPGPIQARRGLALCNIALMRCVGNRRREGRSPPTGGLRRMESMTVLFLLATANKLCRTQSTKAGCEQR